MFKDIIAPLILATALIVSGFLISKGLLNFRNYENTVYVKGLATRNVEADLAIWTLKHSATGNILAEVQNEIKKNSAAIEKFLEKQGLSKSDIVTRKVEVTDLLAQSYRPNNAGDSRYIVSEIMTVRSDKVDMVEKASQNVGDLLAQNIALINEQNRDMVDYVYTGLNDIKPEMIAEATQSARESANQFATDSGAEVGAIKYASQGVFQILPRDSEQSYNERQFRYKTIRVVSTLQYYIN